MPTTVTTRWPLLVQVCYICASTYLQSKLHNDMIVGGRRGFGFRSSPCWFCWDDEYTRLGFCRTWLRLLLSSKEEKNVMVTDTVYMLKWYWKFFNITKHFIWLIWCQGDVSLKLLGSKLVPKLIYLVLKKELLNFSKTALRCVEEIIIVLVLVSEKITLYRKLKTTYSFGFNIGKASVASP